MAERKQPNATGVTESGERIGAVYQAISDRLTESIARSFADRDVAEEAVAEAFSQAMRRGDELRDPAAWIWASAFAIARGTKSRPSHGALGPGDDVGIPSAETDVDVLDALGALSDADRELLIRAHVGGWRSSEIAAAEWVSAATVRSRLLRANRRARMVLAGSVAVAVIVVVLVVSSGRLDRSMKVEVDPAGDPTKVSSPESISIGEESTVGTTIAQSETSPVCGPRGSDSSGRFGPVLASSPRAAARLVFEPLGATPSGADDRHIVMGDECSVSLTRQGRESPEWANVWMVGDPIGGYWLDDVTGEFNHFFGTDIDGEVQVGSGSGSGSTVLKVAILIDGETASIEFDKIDGEPGMFRWDPQSVRLSGRGGWILVEGSAGPNPGFAIRRFEP